MIPTETQAAFLRYLDREVQVKHLGLCSDRYLKRQF
jgi:hypothetical protein